MKSTNQRTRRRRARGDVGQIGAAQQSRAREAGHVGAFSQGASSLKSIVPRPEIATPQPATASSKFGPCDEKIPPQPQTSAEKPFTAQQEQRFEQLFHEHWSWAVNMASRYAGSDAELIASRAMHKALVRFNPEIAPFKKFLARIVFNELASAYRSDSRRRKYEHALSEGFDVVDEKSAAESERRELAEELLALLRLLPAADRELLQLRFYEGYSYDEIVQRR